jgi:hypothetical protein
MNCARKCGIEHCGEQPGSDGMMRREMRSKPCVTLELDATVLVSGRLAQRAAARRTARRDGTARVDRIAATRGAGARMTAADTREPNFFIVGAPKCGTSALAGYLREHPDCFMCWPKEPLFFCEDLSGIRQVESLPEYLHLFADAPPGVRAVGEASAMYFYSQVAIARVRECFASARLIVMLRSPIDLVEAFHAQLQYALAEDQRQLAVAWDLQAEREQGASLPPGCPEPKLLQYRRVALLGDQLRRVLAAVPSEEVHIVVFDDLARDPRVEYLRVLSFLGLRDDGRVDFPAVNARRAHRLSLVSRLTQRPPRSAVQASKALKRRFGLERVGVLDWLRRANKIPAERSRVPAELRRKMADTFAEDVALLSSLLGRDFTPWLAGESVSTPPDRSKTQEI